uniref:non-structural maintenance of chromosomes element 3 homolog n=1 Tax=Pristiophorus japonicus TaxID=55135 RepID=UPI00398F2F83
MPRARNSAAHSSGHRSSQAGTSQQQQDSDADDVGPSQTPTGSQSQHSPDKLTPAAVDRKVSEVVQYILIMEQRKVPVKRKDIIKNVLKDYRSRYTEIMKRTTRTFHQMHNNQDPKTWATQYKEAQLEAAASSQH